MKIYKSVGLIFVLCLCFLAVHIVQAVTSDPGSEANPLVSQDYVDSKMNGLSAATDAKINTISEKVEKLSQQAIDLSKTQASKFQVLELDAGKQLLAGDSTEIVLRSGKAAAVSGTNGGLIDLTDGSGVDLKAGQTMPLNHLILSARNDGRGFNMLSDSWVLVKGDYTLGDAPATPEPTATPTPTPKPTPKPTTKPKVTPTPKAKTTTSKTTKKN
ncbi:MAG TPA: hypothetical protein VF941_10700 [Clostridia bacterium]